MRHGLFAVLNGLCLFQGTDVDSMALGTVELGRVRIGCSIGLRGMREHRDLPRARQCSMNVAPYANSAMLCE